MPREKGTKTITLNRKARHDYTIEDTYEAGIALAGTEVKSLRAGTVNLKDSYCIVKEGELFLVGAHISPYEKGNIFNKDPLRERKLLLHDYEINKLEAEVSRKGYTIVPLTVYLKKGLVKCSIGLARGKKLYDKRESIAKKDAMREAQRDFKDSNKY